MGEGFLIEELNECLLAPMGLSQRPSPTKDANHMLHCRRKLNIPSEIGTQVENFSGKDLVDRNTTDYQPLLRNNLLKKKEVERLCYVFTRIGERESGSWESVVDKTPSISL